MCRSCKKTQQYVWRGMAPVTFFYIVYFLLMLQKKLVFPATGGAVVMNKQFSLALLQGV